MKWIINMFRARLASCLSQPVSWLFVVIAVIMSLAPAAVGGNNDEQRQIPVAVVIEDEGELHRRLLELFNQNPDFNIQILPRDTALHKLQLDQLEAVYIIRPLFSHQLQKGDFRSTIELYTSPSSSAAAALSEPIINNTLMLWIEEAAVQRTRAFLSTQGLSFSDTEAAAQKEEIQKIWAAGLPLEIRTVIPVKSKVAVVDQNQPVAACTQWYGSFAVFYIIVGAGWVLDIRKKGIALRLQQSGASMWQLLAGASLAPLLICMLGWMLALMICSTISSVSLPETVGLVLSMLLYLIAVLGAAMVLASRFSSITGLMLLAPLATFVNAVLGGLMVRLPEWAAVLETISLMMPGRWLNNSIASVMDGSILPPAGLLVCGLAWLLAGCIAGQFSDFSSE